MEDIRIEEERENEKAPKIKKSVALEGFGAFWDEYPRKVAKGLAMMKWAKHHPDEEQRKVMMESLRKYKNTEQWKKDGGIYVPHPATWLQQERWNDEITEDTKPRVIKL